jgi:MoxR-like ATPase
VGAGRHTPVGTDGSGSANGSLLARTRNRIAAQVVGRSHELELLLAAVAAGRDILLEGPPGTSKTTMLKAITHEWDIPLVLVEGNAELTPAKLIGHHHAARVLREDYSPENFVPGPLVSAMREGGFLYIEEFNRAPEDTLNTLLMAIGDRSLAVPRVGVIAAQPSFRVVASMNPFDNVGTTRLSSSIHDRLCRMSLDYQDEAAERDIVSLRTGADNGAAGRPASNGAFVERLVADAVHVTRETRTHPDVRQGSSVRGAIDTVQLLFQLAELRGIAAVTDAGYPDALLDAMCVALSGRIQLDEVADTTPERVLREIWERLLLLRAAADAPG